MDLTHSAADGIATGKVNSQAARRPPRADVGPLACARLVPLAAPSSVGGGRPTGPVAGRAQLGPVRATIGASRHRTPQIALSARANVKIVKWRVAYLTDTSFARWPRTQLELLSVIRPAGCFTTGSADTRVFLVRYRVALALRGCAACPGVRGWALARLFKLN